MNMFVYMGICGSVVLLTIVISGISSYRRFKAEYEAELDMDISLEQMLASEDRIRAFLNENHIRPGAPIQDIATALHIADGGVESGLEGRARLSTPDADGKMLVKFRRGLSKEEMRFDFAHECGHRINKDPIPATRPDGCGKPEIEQLADYAGAALLMPLEKVYADLEGAQYRGSGPRKRIKIIQKLCAEYGVNRMIALRRVKEVYAIKAMPIST